MFYKTIFYTKIIPWLDRRYAAIWPSHKYGKYTNTFPRNFIMNILSYSGLVVHVIVENKWTPSWILLDALNYKVFPYIFSMVICTYSVHITMGNILPNFETKNDLGTAQLLQNLLTIIWSIRSSLLNDL